MRLNLTLSNPETGSTDHVVVCADPETPLAEIRRALCSIQPGELFVRGSPLADEAATLASSGLLDGDVVTIDEAPESTTPARSLELVTVGGPAAGRRWALDEGTFLFGRSRRALISVDDQYLSGTHCRLVVTRNVCTVEDLGSRNGTFVNGRPADGVVEVSMGDVIEVGSNLFEIRRPAHRDADLKTEEPGTLGFNRPARIRPASRVAKVMLPAPPSEPERLVFPWVQVIVPIVVAVLAAVIFRRPEALLFAFMSPVLAISSTVSGRRQSARRTQSATARYEADLAAADARIAEAVESERENLKRTLPDPSTLQDIATRPTRRLWERRSYDPDAGLLRVGLADLPASVTIGAKGADAPPDPPIIESAPASFDLGRAGVVGIAGPDSAVRSVARWLVVQLATLRSPRDMQLVLLTEGHAQTEWEWFRWLPHARFEEPGAPAALVGNDKTTREERVKEILALLDDRLEAVGQQGGGTFSPTVVVVFDGIRALRSLPGVPRLLSEGPAVGILAIGLDADPTRLAEEGKAELVIDPEDESSGSLSVEGLDPTNDVLLDLVDAQWAEDIARSLSPIRDAGSEEGEATIPTSVRFVDLAAVDLERTDDVLARWMLGGRTTEALVGVALDGPFALDLKKDGPHGLVAGTTGSGKSEFLQTLVVSLALVNKPGAMNFVLIDYKGAAAFSDCERLPHTVGLVTNLDGHLTERALVSLDAELHRREGVLKTIGAADVDVAWEKDPAAAEEAELARLVIVIDEFAELHHELPDFLSGLIRIARVGRSLGVHLILATQRPAGVVSPEMRSNTGMRIALRVEDKGDSEEVLETAHAATISRATPGRGFVKAGGSSSLVQFQAARVAGRRKGVSDGIPPPEVRRVPWSRLGYPPPASQRAEPAAEATTDIYALTSLIERAAAESGERRPRTPWLPPLEKSIDLFQIDGQADAAGFSQVVYGLEDAPAEQKQPPATFDVVLQGHLLVAGSARSGRSTALRSLAGAIAQTLSPSDVHLYGLDFGNGALLPLGHLPHCGAVVVRSEAERIERLIERLVEEVIRRQQLLAYSGYGDIQEQRDRSTAAEKLPYLVVFVDRWEGFTTQFSLDSGSELPGSMLRLVREGAGAGLRLVISGDRSLLNDRITSQVEDKLVLRLSDRNDYRAVDINPKQLPDEIPAGRAFRGGSGRELQVGVLGSDLSGQGQGSALQRIAEEAVLRWPSNERVNRPFRVDALPTTISFDAAAALVDDADVSSPLMAIAGVGGDEISPVTVDLQADGPGFVIAGPHKSGRSTALLSLVRSMISRGASAVVVCPRPSPLLWLRGLPGVLNTFEGVPEGKELEAALASRKGPLVIAVDDAEAFARTGADEVLQSYLLAATRGSVAVLVAGQTEDLKAELRGTVVEAKKSKAGLLLSPLSTLDGDAVGLRLARNQVGRMPPGRGLLGTQGEATLIQVPL